MAKKKKAGLSRRQRQIMDIVYQLKNATAAEVLQQLPDRLSDSSVRTILRILVENGHLRIRQDGPRYIYYPTVPQETARQSAIQHLVNTFFGGSMEEALVALIEMPKSGLSKESLETIAKKIEQNRKEGK